jgi:hypothetical protein
MTFDYEINDRPHRDQYDHCDYPRRERRDDRDHETIPLDYTLHDTYIPDPPTINIIPPSSTYDLPDQRDIPITHDTYIPVPRTPQHPPIDRSHYRDRRDAPAPRAPYVPFRNGGPPKSEPNEVLGVFGLSIRTTERDLEDEFARYGDVAKVVIVYDQRVSLWPYHSLQVCDASIPPESDKLPMRVVVLRT